MRWAILISILLFFIPFFWLQPGQMDIGGDENRLFFYDPSNYLANSGWYWFEQVTGESRSYEPIFFSLPFITVIYLANLLINSAYVLISLVNGIKVSVAFLSIYLIIATILRLSFKEKKELLIHTPAILGGLLYITAPIIIGNYEKAVLSHNQVFLNPLVFYLLLQFLVKQKFKYFVYAVLITIIFTHNFSWVGAPPFFAFYPLALLYLLIFVIFIQKQKILVKHVIWAIVLFLGLHAFHIIPEAFNLFRPGSYINERVFNTNSAFDNLNYFYGVLPLSKLSLNFLLDAPFKFFSWLSIIPFGFIILGFVLNKSKSKIFLLTGIFFLLTLYLVTANITLVGVKIYEFLFTLPGYSMFRNFIGQWAFVYTFFYTLLFGFAAYFVLSRLKKTKVLLFTAFLAGVSFIAMGWPFFIGNMVNTTHVQSNNVKIPMKIDPNFEETIAYIRSLKNDGSFISFPFTDCCYTVIHGVDNGAYVGTSPIVRLTGREDINGYQLMVPFSEVFMKLAKDNNYEAIKKLFSLLNIQYVFYNSDPKVYDKTFPGYPYGSMKQYFPTDQLGYQKFVAEVSGEKIYDNKNFHIYEVDKTFDSAHMFPATKINLYNDNKNDWYGKNMSFFQQNFATNAAYLEKESCNRNLGKNVCNSFAKPFSNIPQITFNQINPLKYLVTVKNVKEPYMLVFLDTYHPSWNIYPYKESKSNIVTDNTRESLDNEKQVKVNGYANGWYITPQDFDNKSEYKFTLEMSDQRVFYISLIISISVLLLFTITLVVRQIYKLYYGHRQNASK